MARKWLSPIAPPDESDAPLPLHRRLAWMAIFMLGSVCCVAASAYALRSLLFLD